MCKIKKAKVGPAPDVCNDLGLLADITVIRLFSVHRQFHAKTVKVGCDILTTRFSLAAV